MVFPIRYSRLFWIPFKKHGEKIGNPLIRIYVNKMEKKITWLQL